MRLADIKVPAVYRLTHERHLDCDGRFGIPLFETSAQDRKGLRQLVVEENLNLAFVHCDVTFAAHDIESEEKLRQTTNRFTFGLRKVNDSWLITHEHSSLPINMETGKGIFNLK